MHLPLDVVIHHTNRLEWTSCFKRTKLLSMGVDKGVLGGAQAPPNFRSCVIKGYQFFGPVSSRDINGVLIKRGGLLD